MNTQRTELQTLGQPKWKISTRKLNAAPQRSASVEELTGVIHELRDLLEEYAPAWYSLEHHKRIESALARVAGH